LTLFQEDSPVSRFPWLESKKVKGMTVTYGRKCSGLSEKLSRLGYLVRTYLESCPIAGKTVCEDLEREGYAVTVLNFEAAAVGAPHRRDRVFFVANTESRKSGEQESRNRREGIGRGR